jgi:hypothetical protein
MASRTQLQIVNRVLQRLREPQVTSVSANEYTQMLAGFLNDTMFTMCEGHDWTTFRTEVTFSSVADQTSYQLNILDTDGGAVTSGTPTNDESLLIYDAGNQPMVFDITAGATPFRLMQYDEDYRLGLHREGGVPKAATPHAFSAVMDYTGDIRVGWKFSLYPTPTAVRNYTATFWIPQQELSTNGDDDSTIIHLPPQPLFLGTLFLALNERGEEIGEPGNVAERRWLNALGAAREANMLSRGRTNRYEFVPS